MKLIHILLLFTLFHHNHQPSKKSVIAFTHDATDVLKSYEDGSVEQWLEQSRIFVIDKEIHLLIANPKRKDVVVLEEVIQEELTALQAYDYKLQQDAKEHRLTPETISVRL